MRLDELYKMTAYVYQDANMARSKEATFLHFVEVCALLTETAREKNRSKVDVAGAICKTLGWYFPLLSKMGVDSAEQLIFAKFPAVCPYCRLGRHDEENCKLVLGTDVTVDHAALARLREDNGHLIPDSLNGWQDMFQTIYPRNLNSGNFSTIAIFEELGEIAEAIRVFDRHPHYFFGEAADIFSYIMGFANEYKVRLRRDGKSFDLESEYLSRYPGLCINCGSRSCVCPPIPDATIGRMSKEMPIQIDELRITDINHFYDEGNTISLAALAIAGNDIKLSTHLPVDRGDLNSTLVQLSLRLSAAVEDIDPPLSEKLRLGATQIASNKSQRGTLESSSLTGDILLDLRSAWAHLDDAIKESIRAESREVDDLSRIFDKRILLVTANADSAKSRILRLDKEHRAIKEAIRRAGVHHKYFVETLTACTIDDFRHALQDRQYEVIHFSGHANGDGLAFCKEQSGKDILPIEALQEVLRGQRSLECVVLNACDSLLGAGDDIAPLTIGMMDEIDDAGAVEFSRGFYEALARGCDPNECFTEGIATMKAKGHRTEFVAKITGKT